MNNQRKKHYLSRPLQGNLIIAIVILEISLLAAIMIFLHMRFSAMIEHDLYAIHSSSQTDLLFEFAEQIGLSAFWLLCINTIFLYFILRFWSRQVKTLIGSLRKSMDQISRLHFPEQDADTALTHELQAILKKWFSVEQTRISELKQEVTGIEIKNNYMDSELQNLRDRLIHCKQLVETGDLAKNKI